MSIKAIQCPCCGGQKIEFSEKIEYSQYYTIDHGRLFKTHKTMNVGTGKFWLRCLECSQKEDFDEGVAIWPSSFREEKILKEMTILSRSADVSEFLEKEYK